jgi:hypothetical protein
MDNRHTVFRFLVFVGAPVLLAVTLPAGQARLANPTPPVAPLVPTAPSQRDVALTQTELIKLLRLSPTLTTVVSHDPSLLSNQEYVAHNNPQLAEFLAEHPEVARNPEFYLFTNMNREDGQPDVALERAVWPDVYRSSARQSAFGDFVSNLPPLLAFACFLVFALWMVRIFVENRRWSRIFKLQSEVHGRLIDKFSTNQELAAYMETEAGKRFLEAAPIPVNLETGQRVPNAVARVLTPLQIGIVLVLLGIGLYSVRHVTAEAEVPLLILSVLTMMPGIGFIIGAGLTWILAARLGLMPDGSATTGKFDTPFGSQGRQ